MNNKQLKLLIIYSLINWSSQPIMVLWEKQKGNYKGKRLLPYNYTTNSDLNQKVRIKLQQFKSNRMSGLIQNISCKTPTWPIRSNAMNWSCTNNRSRFKYGVCFDTVMSWWVSWKSWFCEWISRLGEYDLHFHAQTLDRQCHANYPHSIWFFAPKVH